MVAMIVGLTVCPGYISYYFCVFKPITSLVIQGTTDISYVFFVRMYYLIEHSQEHCEPLLFSPSLQTCHLPGAKCRGIPRNDHVSTNQP
jgi:hypothetical protein